MDIPLQKKVYSQQFRTEWLSNEDFKGWLKSVDSKVMTSLSLSSTKCTEIIREVSGPHFLEAVIRDISDQKYRIILEESTDITIISIDLANISDISIALTRLIKESGLQMENMIGIGTDTASVMIGVNNGVHKILKEEYGISHLILVLCVCHSLQLSVSHASEK
ncbi:hypothetical protein PR048_005325 [Dryococelus australis]|uniref:DUF4371 domain-containing protein n=1 Tax=Dryococelus australis TaxID=614101 RepID=A0ABQ9I7W3_9NEOP|nr:hypothetical protein PR048_005325 [Dryococelus australis]